MKFLNLPYLKTFQVPSLIFVLLKANYIYIRTLYFQYAKTLFPERCLQELPCVLALKGQVVERNLPNLTHPCHISSLLF